MPASPAFPLSGLLGRLQLGFVGECEERLRQEGFPDLKVTHGATVLRHLDRERPVPTAALVQAAGVTKQAVSQQVAYLRRQGYVTVVPDEHDGRARALRLTDRGAAGLAALQRAFAQVESDWRRRYGAARIDTLRSALQEVADRIGGS